MKVSRGIAALAAAATSLATVALYAAPAHAVAPQQAAAAATQVKVLTYNVKHQSSADPADKSWAKRRAAVVDNIGGEVAGIVGLQEVRTDLNGNMETYLENHLANPAKPKYFSYQEVAPAPTGNANVDKRVNPIFYRASKFKVVLDTDGGRQAGVVPFTGKVNGCTPAGGNLRWAQLEDKTTGRRYFVVNTHLTYKAACAELRQSEAHQLHKAMVANNPDRYPPILMGDFNVDNQASEKTLDIIGEPPTASDSQSPHWYNLNASLPLSNTTTASTTFNHGWDLLRSNDSSRIDYIWAGTRFTPADHHIDVSAYQLTPQTKATPSDHYAVAVHLHIGG